MATQLDTFEDQPQHERRRYPWEGWTGGGVWDIRRGDDYDVTTESMRTNLHIKAGELLRKVQTRKVSDEQSEGLVFQFLPNEEMEAVRMAAEEDAPRVNEAMDLLYAYPWPGNIRELENAVLHAVSLCDGVVYPEHLPIRIRESIGTAGDVIEFGKRGDQIASDMAASEKWPSLSEMQERYVSRVIAHTLGNKQAAARILNIDRKTIGRILDRTG